MQRLLMWLSAIALLYQTPVTCAADGATPPPISRRQAIKVCMMKQMTANKAIPYNDASKACAKPSKAGTVGINPGNQAKQKWRATQ